MSTTCAKPKPFTGRVDAFLVPCEVYVVDGHIVDIQISERTKRMTVIEDATGLHMAQAAPHLCDG